MYNKNTVSKKIYIKNMLGRYCIRIVKKDFEKNNITVLSIKQGFAEIQYNTKEINNQKISEILAFSGMSLIKNNDEKIIEKLKVTFTTALLSMLSVISILFREKSNFSQLSATVILYSPFICFHKNCCIYSTYRNPIDAFS